MANSWNFDGKPVLLFEVRERNTIFMMVTELRGIARREGKILIRETQEKTNSSLPQVVMAKYLRFGTLFSSLSKNILQSAKMEFCISKPFPFLSPCLRTKYVWPFYKQVSYLLIRYYLICPQKLRYQTWLLQKIIEAFTSHFALA